MSYVIKGHQYTVHSQCSDITKSQIIMTSFPVHLWLGQVKEAGAPVLGKSKTRKSDKFYSDSEEEEEEEEEGSSSEDSSSSTEGKTWALACLV